VSILVDDLIVNPADTGLGGVEASLSEAGLSIIGASFGDSVQKGTQVQTSTGIVMVDRQPETRTVIVKLIVREDSDVTLPEAAHRLEQIVSHLQTRGSWIRRDFHVGGDFESLLYHVTGEVTLADFAGWQVGDNPDVTLTMICNFAAYSTEEVESEEFKEEVARDLIYELPPSNGTAEGTKRIAVKNLNASADWRGLIWAEECVDAPDDLEDPTAQLAYAAADLTPKGGASVKTVSGLEVVEHAALTAGWLTILDSEIAGVGHMTHRGARRLWLRVYDPGEEAGGVQFKVRWRTLGSLHWSEDNPVKRSLLVDDWQWYDMGECRPQRAVQGDERWECQVQARAPGGSGAIRLHRFDPAPTEQYAVLRAPGESQVADAQSTKSPGTVTGAGWSSPESAKASDNSRTTAELDNPFGPVSTAALIATKFGNALPEDAIVAGVVVDVEGSVSGGSATEEIHLDEVKLVKGGVKVGSNRGNARPSVVPTNTSRLAPRRTSLERP
jgi:hypothetical protein